MSLFTNPEILKALGAIRERLPEIRQRQVELKQRIRSERQCTEPKKNGDRCEAWAVHGDKKCVSHGGIKSEPSVCNCSAYDFPHRARSGNCNYPDAPRDTHRTDSYKRKSKKRMKKLRSKQWLKDLGL